MATSEPASRYAGALAGITVVVTGAGSGIGRAIARAMAKSGAEAILIGRRAHRLRETAALIGAEGRRAVVAPADVGDANALDEAVARAGEELGTPDIAVAAAGVNAWADLPDLTPEVLRAALATNLEGVANLARAVVPGMLRRARGKLIVIASDNGRRPEAGGSGYAASKFGAVGLALSLSQELYRTPVSVHVVEPGCVDTEWYPPEEPAPRERMLRPDDVALITLFLATLPPHIVLEEVMPLPRAMLARPWQ